MTTNSLKPLLVLRFCVYKHLQSDKFRRPSVDPILPNLVTQKQSGASVIALILKTCMVGLVGLYFILRQFGENLEKIR